jgi:4-diphosphocytidyl-2-C-methyl-D-erythritol kinase
MEPDLQCRSFAKINLGLRILGKRPDGYHEIDTILQTVSLHDDITFTRRTDQQILLSCDDPTIPTGQSNLIIKAAASIQQRFAQTTGVDISLTKRIPAQGGLGGASSNAAITVIALNTLWKLELQNAEIEQFLRPLGSDVPFFLSGGTARAQGTGTVISSLPDVSLSYLIIVTPNARVSTPTAYASLNAPSLTTQESLSILSSSFVEPSFGDSNPTALHNDFEGVIFEIEPEIRRAKEALLDSGAQGGLLAGSGSSVFGLFENEDAREQASADLKREQGWRVFSCKTISRDTYLSSLISSGSRYLSSLNFQTDNGA